jgi:hypothetical protein
MRDEHQRGVVLALAGPVFAFLGACGGGSQPALASTNDRVDPRPPRAIGQGGWEEFNQGQDAPPAGEDTAAVYDAVRHRLMIYGGKDNAETNRNELWTLDLETRRWTQILPAGPLPPPREDHSLVLDERNDELVLFGGEDGSTTGATWIYDIAANRWQDITHASAPALEGHVAIHDPRGRRMVVFGGMHQDKARKDDKVLEDETWVLDLDRDSPSHGTWARLAVGETRPSARREHRGVYDPVGGRMIVFGGRRRSKTSFLNDTWILDLERATWRELETSGERPDPIRQTALGYDPETDLLTVFGGRVFVEQPENDEDFLVNQVWVLDLPSGTWSNRTPHPRPMYDHQGVFVPEFGGTLVYGGSTQWPGKEHETWLLRVR